MFSIIKEQKCMPHILSAYGIHIWIMVYTWIEYHDRCLNWEKKKDRSLDNAGARMQNSHKHFLFSPRFNSTVCNKGLQKSNHSTWKKEEICLQHKLKNSHPVTWVLTWSKVFNSWDPWWRIRKINLKWE